MRKELFFDSFKRDTISKNYIYMYNCTVPQEIINCFALAWQKKAFRLFWVIQGMIFEFKYVGEFKFIFENYVGYESGDQEGAFDERIQKSKISR